MGWGSEGGLCKRQIVMASTEYGVLLVVIVVAVAVAVAVIIVVVSKAKTGQDLGGGRFEEMEGWKSRWKKWIRSGDWASGRSVGTVTAAGKDPRQVPTRKTLAEHWYGVGSSGGTLIRRVDWDVQATGEVLRTCPRNYFAHGSASNWVGSCACRRRRGHLENEAMW